MPVIDYDALLLQISTLRQEKNLREEELKFAWKSFAASMNPVAIVKDSLHELTQDPEIKADLGSAAMHAGATLIIGKVLGKHRSIKGYVASVVLEKLYFSFVDGPLFKRIIDMRSKKQYRNTED